MFPGNHRRFQYSYRCFVDARSLKLVAGKRRPKRSTPTTGSLDDMECEIPPEAKAAYCMDFFVPIILAALLSFAISVLYTLISRLLSNTMEVDKIRAHFEDIVPKSAAVMINNVLANVHALPGDTCSICREGLVRPVKLPCGHTGCDPCLRKWISQSDTCPFCRSFVFQSIHSASARAAERLVALNFQMYREVVLSSIMDAALAAMSLAVLQCLGIGVSLACCFGYRQANSMAAIAVSIVCYALPLMVVAILCVDRESVLKSMVATTISVAICV